MRTMASTGLCRASYADALQKAMGLLLQTSFIPYFQQLLRESELPLTPFLLIPRSHSRTAYLYRCVWSGIMS